ncbi:MAG: VanZ family protein, partial [Roseburia sp.]|nr:VanZ family protein [Roseburia sp.]
SSQLSDALALELFDLGLFEMGTAGLMELVTFFLRKGAHMAVYFVLTALLVHALRGLSAPLKRGGAALGLCAALAALDELHQFFVPDRSCQLSDVLVDILGGGIFLLLWAVIYIIKTKRDAP